MTVMTDIQAGIDDRHTEEKAQSAAAAFAPMKIQTPRSSSWTREEGVRYLVALDVDGTLVDHDGHMSRGVKDTLRAVVGAFLLLLVLTGTFAGTAGWIAGIVGAVMLGTAALRVCPAYRLIGVNTCRM